MFAKLILTVAALASDCGLIPDSFTIDIDSPRVRIWAEIEITSSGLTVREWGT